MIASMNRVIKLLGVLLCTKFIFIKCDLKECTNRFENQEDIQEALPELKNCSVVRNRFPICGKRISVLYTQQPPYVVSSKNGNDPVGLLPDLLSLALDICCFGCLEVTFHGPIEYLQKFRPSNDTLFMPLQSAFNSKQFAGHDYIPFMKTRGVSVFAKERTDHSKAHENTHHLMQSVLSTWPLFVIAILMAITSGCVMWCLDTWFNDEDFPHRFPRGPFEGFWWAFVAMTTVGFGDRVPKSFIARAFAILWIFVGITVFSMYTAVLTSALAVEPVIFEHTSFDNKTVGVLSFTAAGESVVLEEHGNYKKFHTIEEMAEALETGDVHAIALDDKIARYYTHDIRKIVPTMRLHHRVSGLENSYGVVSHDSDITHLLRSFFETNEDQRHAMVVRALYHRWPEMRHEAEKVNKQTFIDSNSPIYKSAVVGLVIIGIIAIIVGAICRMIFQRNDAILVKYVNCMEGNWKLDLCAKIRPTETNFESDRKVIETCINELEQFSARWKNKLQLLSAECGKVEMGKEQQGDIKYADGKVNRLVEPAKLRNQGPENAILVKPAKVI